MPFLPLPITGDLISAIDAALLRRMWSEFVEMPGLRLTRAQAQRLWGVDAQTCGSALDALVALQLLVRGADDKYSRPSIVSESFRRAG